MKRPEYEKMYALEDSHWWFVGRRRLLTTLIERWIVFGPQDRVLDVGCGTGGNLAHLTQPGIGVGVDLSPLALDLARHRSLIRLTQASGLALPYPTHTFKLVTMFDVLYHRWIIDDEQAIREAYRVLQPGGWLLLTDAALPLLWSTHDEVYYARQRYTLNDILEKLTRTGFNVRVCSYVNTLLLPLVAVARLVADRFLPVDHFTLRPSPAWMNKLFIGVWQLEARWLGWGGTLPLGSSLICLTQKNLN